MRIHPGRHVVATIAGYLDRLRTQEMAFQMCLKLTMLDSEASQKRAATVGSQRLSLLTNAEGVPSKDITVAASLPWLTKSCNETQDIERERERKPVSSPLLCPAVAEFESSGLTGADSTTCTKLGGVPPLAA